MVSRVIQPYYRHDDEGNLEVYWRANRPPRQDNKDWKRKLLTVKYAILKKLRALRGISLVDYMERFELWVEKSLAAQFD